MLRRYSKRELEKIADVIKANGFVFRTSLIVGFRTE